MLSKSVSHQNSRGVAPVVGAVLLFAIVIIAFSIYHATVIPMQNQGIEFDHSNDIQSDMEELSVSLIDVRDTNSGTDVRDHQPVRLRLGTQYPTRLISVNPPSPTGSITAENPGTISFQNADVDGELLGDPESNLLGTAHPTKLLTYEPQYNEYREHPTTIFEHSLVYNRYENAPLPVTDQRLVRGGSTRLNIVVFEGELAESGLSTTIAPETLDGPTAEVPITAASGSTFDVVIPSKTPEVWTDESVIGETFSEGESNARAAVTGENEVTITLNDDESIPGQWTVQMTTVGFNGGTVDDTFSSIQEPEQDPDLGDIESVAGPKVELDAEEFEISFGEELDLSEIGGTVTSVGSDSIVRSGTPIQAINYSISGESATDSGVVKTFDPDDSFRVVGLDDLEDAVIGTDDWGIGEFTLTITGQDAAGIISEAGVDDDSLTIIVTDGASNLVAGEDNQSQTFGFALEDELEDGDTIEIDLSGTEGIDYPRGSSEYNVVSGNGEVSRSVEGRDGVVEIEYSSDGDDSGAYIELLVEEIDVAEDTDDTFELPVTIGGETTYISFDVISDG